MTTHRPFLYITGFYSFGIALDHFARLPFGCLCLLIFIFLVAGVGISRKTFLSTVFLLLAITGLGMVYTQSRQGIDRDHVMHVAKYYYKKPVAVKGVIVSDVQQRAAVNGSKTTFTLDVREVQAPWEWQKKNGKILVNIFKDLDVDYGDYVMLEGKLHRPYNFSAGKNFSYRNYLYRRDIRFILSVKKDADIRVLGQNHGNSFRALSLKLRDKFKGVLSESLSKNEAGIMRAVLLGDRSGIPKPVRTLFVQTGTAHILAISGLHMGVVAALLLVFAKIIPIGRRGQLGLVIFLLMNYAFLTGGRPSVVRATIMTVVFLASFIVEKEFDAFNTLCLAAMIILMINPLNLFDVGFQLSFVCVLTILYINRGVKKKDVKNAFRKDIKSNGRIYDRWFHYTLQSFYLSLAIWIGVAGLIAYYFGIITPITILANLVVVPLISIVVALGFGLLAIGIILPSWAFMFAACLKAVLNVMVGLIYLFDKAPLAHILVSNVKPWHVMLYYGLLLAVIYIPLEWKRFTFVNKIMTKNIK